MLRRSVNCCARHASRLRHLPVYSDNFTSVQFAFDCAVILPRVQLQKSILESIRRATALQSVEELAKGIKFVSLYFLRRALPFTRIFQLRPTCVLGKHLNYRYKESVKTNWKAPRYILDMPEKVAVRIRERYNIDLEGLDLEGISPPITTFQGMKVFF